MTPRTTNKSIHQLTLHESILIYEKDTHPIEITRVPGGWIYKMSHSFHHDFCEACGGKIRHDVGRSCIFVPYHDEFEDETLMTPAEDPREQQMVSLEKSNYELRSSNTELTDNAKMLRDRVLQLESYISSKKIPVPAIHGGVI